MLCPLYPATGLVRLGKWVCTFQEHSLSVTGTHDKEVSHRSKEKWSKLLAGGGRVDLGRE